MKVKEGPSDVRLELKSCRQVVYWAGRRYGYPQFDQVFLDPGFERFPELQIIVVYNQGRWIIHNSKGFITGCQD